MPVTPQSPPSFWKLEVTLPRPALASLEAAFEDEAVSITLLEADEEKDLWTFQALFEERPDEWRIQTPVALAAASVRVAEPEILVERLEGRDWLALSKIAFPPLEVGRFFIHGSHFEGTPPVGARSLCIDAATAFGSGYHQSTYGCLQALEMLDRCDTFQNILDVGCGSGILSLAAARAWGVPVLAIDIDPESVRVARENARINGLSSLVQTAQGNGASGRLPRSRAPYDLILANILARPLCGMASRLASLLAPGGRIVLAGLLTRQAPMVIAAYRARNLVLEKRIEVGVWSTLVVRRPCGERSEDDE
ncbi:50S ribosomal protein L11 methyltransferase [Phaeovibrio sulfidiphilus]|uniref:Ribosomal protein L11 methyltransferase n=1 Tax=Phaeovibrio sulfidiphilus TaxID=1220600 RepID=A0A8J6YM07_9PROT|nr:50S ribosomal protein L11 methyltransferase [Phaeovibrio sulfidiphilus]MBE1236890.1 50S ribosomal protein L11 methyltransferase [Phaeovibrio sulfidiphilus]